MIKLCAIGVSHLAAIKMGLPLMPPRDDVEITFFGAPGDVFRDIDIVDGVATPRAEEMREAFAQISGGQDRIRLADYDAFAFFGFIGLKQVMTIYKSYYTHDQNWRDGKRLASIALFDNLLWKNQYLGWSFLEFPLQVRKATNATVLYAEQPRPSSQLLAPDYRGSARSEERYFPWRMARQFKDEQNILRAHDRQVRRWAENGILYVTQPEETVFDSLFSDAKFSRGSRKLLEDKPHGEADVVHMNGEFGGLMLAKVLKTIDAQRQGGQRRAAAE